MAVKINTFATTRPLMLQVIVNMRPPRLGHSKTQCFFNIWDHFFNSAAEWWRLDCQRISFYNEFMQCFIAIVVSEGLGNGYGGLGPPCLPEGYWENVHNACKNWCSVNAYVKNTMFFKGLGSLFEFRCGVATPMCAEHQFLQWFIQLHGWLVWNNHFLQWFEHRKTIVFFRCFLTCL